MHLTSRCWVMAGLRSSAQKQNIGKNTIWRSTDKHTCGKQPLLLSFCCMLLILTVVSLKVLVLCHAYFIGCRWYLLCIYACLFECSVPSTYSTSCQGWGIWKWHCGAPRTVILMFVWCEMVFAFWCLARRKYTKKPCKIKVCSCTCLRVRARAFSGNCLSVSQRVCKLPALVQVFASMHARACVWVCVHVYISKAISGFRSNGVWRKGMTERESDSSLMLPIHSQTQI